MMNELKRKILYFNADGVDFVPTDSEIIFNNNGNTLSCNAFKSYTKQQIFNNEYEVFVPKQPYKILYWLITNNGKKHYILEHSEDYVDSMDFSKALNLLKNGHMAYRISWDKNQFLYYVPKGSYLPCTEIAMKITNYDGLVDYKPYIALKTIDNDVVPWTPSITDILADDWVVD